MKTAASGEVTKVPTDIDEDDADGSDIVGKSCELVGVEICGNMWKDVEISRRATSQNYNLHKPFPGRNSTEVVRARGEWRIEGPTGTGTTSE